MIFSIYIIITLSISLTYPSIFTITIDSSFKTDSTNHSTFNLILKIFIFIYTLNIIY